MALDPGTRFGIYDISAQIGEGGMGQVYRATDTKLKRQVAIKTLPAANVGTSFDVLPDGRLVMIRGADQAGTREIIVVQNWFQELKRLAPGN